MLGGARRAERWAWLLCVALAACGSKSARERCDDDAANVTRCGREFRDDLCAEKGGRCAAACYGRATCAELDQGSPPAWLNQCLFKCLETAACEDDGHAIRRRWLCDGENDCVDGSDERSCRYFECVDGALVGQEQRCDEWPDCTDDSDEAHCP